MKIKVFSLAIITITLMGCNSNSSKEINSIKVDSGKRATPQTVTAKPAPANNVVTKYLQLKNALADDNAKDAAKKARQLFDIVQQIDKKSLTTDQKKLYDELKDDIEEHAEHISKSKNKIEHQRFHFDMLSKDMYDFVKVFKVNVTLYQIYCPMFNQGKGATWLSEVKEIKNPYLGHGMPECGTINEEIKGGD